MARCRGKLNFYHWLAVSFVLHSCVVLPCILTGMHAPYQDKHNKLLIELYGMVANRQVEEKKKGTDVPQNSRASQQSIPRQVKKAVPKQPPDKPKEAAPDTPVHVEKAHDLPNPAQQAAGPTPMSIASSPTVAGTAGGDVEQTGQSIRYVDQGADRDADRIRGYLASLTKRLQANLVYPQEVRKNGIEGTSTIAFTITQSGTIREGSLRVQRSSGYAALDAHALKSALVSAPFEKPPKELDVSIAVRFSDDTARPRNRVSAH